MPFCTQCGKEVDETDRFCPNCGAQLVGREEEGPPEAVKEDVGVAQKYYEDKFSEVTIANVGFVSFPQRCPRCLTPNPDSKFALRFNEWIGANRWRKWSLKAPICSSFSSPPPLSLFGLVFPYG